MAPPTCSAPSTSLQLCTKLSLPLVDGAIRGERAAADRAGRAGGERRAAGGGLVGQRRLQLGQELGVLGGSAAAVPQLEPERTRGSDVLDGPGRAGGLGGRQRADG